MGQTLTNGVYLPDEGERYCYAGLAANWRALDAVIGGYNTHIANLDIHVTAADKNAWNGHVANNDIHVTAADKTGWNNHVGNSDIHVTAADKTNWNGKADDTDVMHLSGDETSTGNKNFSDDVSVKILTATGKYISDEGSTNRRTVLKLLAGARDADGYSCSYVTRVRSNKAQGALISSDVQTLGFDFVENQVRTLNTFIIRATNWSNDVPQKIEFTSNISEYTYGNSTNKAKINDLNPGALSFPDLSAGLDISSYLDTSQSSQNYYTPPVDGWISIKGRNPSATIGIAIIQSDFCQMGYTVGDFGTSNRVSFCALPVKAGVQVEIWLKSVTIIDFAKFYPSIGNI